jgi:hypothetical protein
MRLQLTLALSFLTIACSRPEPIHLACQSGSADFPGLPPVAKWFTIDAGKGVAVMRTMAVENQFCGAEELDEPPCTFNVTPEAVEIVSPTAPDGRYGGHFRADRRSGIGEWKNGGGPHGAVFPLWDCASAERRF